MTSIQQILAGFEPINLQEMDGVKLMDRTDTKFVLHLDQFLLILPELKKNYRALDINGIRMSQYETLYYDTEDFQLYHKHQNKKLNRYKIRARHYVESDLNFFEIKFKNNKGRTIKDRIRISKLNKNLEQKERDLLFEKTGIRFSEIQPTIWVNYHRTTLVSKISCERVTIDSGLHFIKDGETKRYENLIIVEVKQERAAGSPITEELKKYTIREGSLSKYCLGIMSMIPGIKQNNFKKNILTINKLLYATTD
jgi:hypothetical protein